MKTPILLLLSFCYLLIAFPLQADDWPQFRGPDRTDVSKEKGLLQKWPKNGPPLLWRFKKTGIGFSGPAIVGDRLYIMGARKDTNGKELEYLIALDLANKGKELWAIPIGPVFTWKGNSYGDGPRGTPSVDGKRIYALGGQGELICVDIPSKGVKWRKNFPMDFGGKHMNLWGYCESPLVDGNQVVCSPGSAKEGTIITLDKNNGKVKWKCKELKDEATFGSMVVANFGGVRQYVHTTFKGPGMGGRIVGVAAKDGKVLWSVDQKFDDVDVCATPIVHKNTVYLSGGRKTGCTLLHITKKGRKFKAKIDPAYKKPPIRRVMDNEHGGVALLGDHLYGYTDSRGGGWVCQDWKTGKAVWTEKRKLGKGCLTCAGGQLYLYSEDDGTVVLLEPTPRKTNYWKENGRFEIPEKSKVPQTRKSNSGAKIWTHPVVANGRLYLRDQEFLFCYDVQANKQVKKAKKK
jgi:outer membrane protein assembly factor BamB